jgi:hypothetical protein
VGGSFEDDPSKMGVRATIGAASTRLLMGNMACLTEVLFGGICHRFPTLKLFTVESGVGWLPSFLETCDWQFVNGSVPVCPLTQIQGKFTAQAQASCPQSIVGGGSVQVNGGAIGGTVTIFAGGPTTMYIQTDIGPGATTLTIIGRLAGRSLTFSNIPNTPGLVLSKFDTTFNKRKSGKKKGVKTFYVMARCKNKKWTNSESTNFYSGQTLSASSTQKCKQTKK